MDDATKILICILRDDMGWSFPRIGALIGITRGTANKAYQRWKKKAPKKLPWANNTPNITNNLEGLGIIE